MKMPLDTSSLHYAIVTQFLERQHAPLIDELAVQFRQPRWWANCAWCSAGIATLVGDVTITTTLGAETRQTTVRVENGKLRDEGLLVHFPVPMRHVWDNVIYTCSTMLLFEYRSQDRRLVQPAPHPEGQRSAFVASLRARQGLVLPARGSRLEEVVQRRGPGDLREASA